MFGSTHSDHCFVYADYGVKEDEIRNQLNDPKHGFRGYETFRRIELTERDLAPNGGIGHTTAGEGRKSNTGHASIKDQRYGLIEILERTAVYDEVHGAKRLAILFLGADGVATFDALFCQKNSCPPFAIVLQDHGFGGNYTQFGRDGLLEKIAERARTYPDLLLCADNTKPWASYAPVPNAQPAFGGMHGHGRQLYICGKNANVSAEKINGEMREAELADFDLPTTWRPLTQQRRRLFPLVEHL